MTHIAWTPALEVGVPEIDADHRVLVDLLNRITAASNEPDDSEVRIVLSELEDYTLYHFAREERMMDDIDYEFNAIHREEHRQLFVEVRNQLDDLNAGRLVAASVALFMQRWLLRHIAGSDRHLGEALTGLRPPGQAA